MTRRSAYKRILALVISLIAALILLTRSCSAVLEEVNSFFIR